MDASCVVSRALLSLADLELQDLANGYELDAIGPGIRTWSRITASSPYVHGDSLVAARQQQSSGILRVHVTGSTAAELESRTAALLAAFDQFAYTLTVTIDGVGRVWTCDPADYGPVPSGGSDGSYDEFELAVFQQTYAFTVPHQPITTGSM